MEQSVNKGRFREDLYYRLNVIPLVVPPLRERGEDVGILSQHYLDHFSNKFNKDKFALTDKAQKALFAYRWPGNIRELKNIMAMLVIMCDESLIRLSDLPPRIIEASLPLKADEDVPQCDICLPGDLSDSPLADQLNYLERSIIDRALDKAKGIKTNAALRLGISRYTLLRRLKALSQKTGKA